MSNINQNFIPTPFQGQLSNIRNAPNYDKFCEAVDNLEPISPEPGIQQLTQTDVPAFWEEDFAPAYDIGDVSDFISNALRQGALMPASHVYALMGNMFVGVTGVASYRGYYNNIMFDADTKLTSAIQVAAFGAMLEYACNNGEFYGYKGGEFYMNSSTPAYIDFYGSANEHNVSGCLIYNSNLVIFTDTTDV